MQLFELLIFSQQLRSATMGEVFDLFSFFVMLLSPCAVALRCVLLAELSSDAGLVPPGEVLVFKRLRNELLLPLQAGFRHRIVSPAHVYFFAPLHLFVVTPVRRYVFLPAASRMKALSGTAWLHLRARTGAARRALRISRLRMDLALQLRSRLSAGVSRFDPASWILRRRQSRSAAGRA